MIVYVIKHRVIVLHIGYYRVDLFFYESKLCLVEIQALLGYIFIKLFFKGLYLLLKLL